MKTFSLFGAEHLYTLLGYFIFMIVILFLASFSGSKRKFARTISILIIALKIAELSYRHYISGEQISSLFPLHFYNLTLVVAIISMLFPKKNLFQISYFWSTIAIFVLLTSEVQYGFPNFLNISFFITNFYLIFSVLYELIYFRFRPTKSGLISSFILINIIALFAHFTDWSYSIFIIEFIYLLASLLLYFPFRQRSYKIKLN